MAVVARGMNDGVYDHRVMIYPDDDSKLIPFGSLFEEEGRTNPSSHFWATRPIFVGNLAKGRGTLTELDKAMGLWMVSAVIAFLVQELTLQNERFYPDCS